MKVSKIAQLTCLASTVVAVYPPVKGDPSIERSDLVTIQSGSKQPGVPVVGATAAGAAAVTVEDELDASGENSISGTSKEDEKKLDSYIKSQLTQASIESNGVAKDFGDEEKSTNAFFLSTSMIVVSEIGDKTFLVAALMAMRYPRMQVFSAAVSALIGMTVLSGVIGHALPALLPQRFTQFLAAVLFVVFGINLLKEGLSMSKNAGVEDEMAEVQEEIECSNINQSGSSMEEGNLPGANYKKLPIHKDLMLRVSNVAKYVFSPVWIQTFMMTFVGEWGDRSQIATIAMAAGSDYWLVILGGIVGHSLCTGLAVIGGQLLATKISMRNVTLGGAFAFFIFSVLYFYNAYYDIES